MWVRVKRLGNKTLKKNILLLPPDIKTKLWKYKNLKKVTQINFLIHTRMFLKNPKLKSFFLNLILSCFPHNLTWNVKRKTKSIFLEATMPETLRNKILLPFRPRSWHRGAPGLQIILGAPFPKNTKIN